MVGTEAQVAGCWDEGRLDQVLHNLLENAIKYSDEDSEVTVRVEARERAARVVVADSGIGIAPADLPKLFERFYRSREAADCGRGLGLGLYVCRALVEAHGGRIWAESRPGEGSTFSFSLPRVAPDGDGGRE